MVIEYQEGSRAPSRVQHGRLGPVHVLGYGSSGTSIFCQLLREKLGVGIGTESQFIVRYFRRLDDYGDLSREQNQRQLVLDLVQERWFQRNRKFGFDVDLEAILADVKQPSYRGVLDAVFGQLAQHLGADRWGDKTPDYAYDLDVLWELFPDGQYIHVVRDGRDVAHSVMNRYWGPKNVFVAAHQWLHQLTLIEQFLETVPPEQKLEIRYEDLLAHPIETMQCVGEYLQVTDLDGPVMEHIRETVPNELSRDNSGKWRRSWSESQRNQFERIAFDQLKKFNYAIAVDKAGEPPGPAARLYWNLDNRMRKLAWRDYWKDNLYKVGLHARQRWQRIHARIARSASK